MTADTGGLIVRGWRYGRGSQRSQADAWRLATQVSGWSLGRVVPRPLARSVATRWR
jgi:hypothetical protein